MSDTSLADDESESSYSLSQELSRSISLGTLLVMGYKLFGQRSDCRDDQENIEIYELSSSTKRFDCFISHSWASKGLKKWLAIMWFHNWIGALCSGVTVAVFTMYLPHNVHKHAEFCLVEEMSGILTCISGYPFVAGLLVIWAGLVFGSHISNKRCFLDFACVHQVDQALKTAGIQQIPRVVQKSSNMILLWDETYFTRGFCAYEVALALSSFPDPAQQIHILPLDIYAAVTTLHLLWALGNGAMILLWGSDVLISSAVSLPVAMLPSTAEAALARTIEAQKRELEKLLEHFCFSATSFERDADRVEVISSIETMFPGGLDEFDCMMQTRVKDFVVEQFGQSGAVLPYRLALVVAIPSLLLAISCQAAYTSQNLYLQLAHLIYVANVFFFLSPTATAMSMALSLCIGKPAELQERTWRFCGGLQFRYSYICAGTAGTLYMLISTLSCENLPVMLATGQSSPPWYGLLLSLFLASLSAVIAASFWQKASD